jgi:4-amino-4-deoxy-L-arabinose transferase-like glycosyltransferase
VTRAAPLALALAALLAFLLDLGAQDIWSRDEARPALVARQMLETRDWLVPHIGGRVYVEKPPLFSWMVALASRRGVDEWSLRLPSALAGAATVGVTCLLGARLIAPVAGLIAGATLASSFTVFQWARTGRMETLLVLWITLAVWSLARWLDGGRARDSALLGLWTALGVMTKGPVALIPLGLGLLAVLILRERPIAFLRHALLALGVATAVVLLWVVLARLTSPDAEAYFRGLGPRISHEMGRPRPRSVGFLLEVVGGGFLPWSLLLPATAIMLAREWRLAWRPLVLPLLWVAFVLVVFSVVIAPREAYFLPAFPALALLVAWTWHAASERGRWILLALMATLAAAPVTIAAWVLVSGAPINVTVQQRILVEPSIALAVVAVAPLVALGLAAALLATDRCGAAAMTLAGGVLILFATVETQFHTPMVNRAMATRAAAQELARALPDHARLAYVDRRLIPAVVFYLPQRSVQLPTHKAVRRLIGKRNTYVLFPELEFDDAHDRLGLPLRRVAQVTVDRTVYVLAAVEGPG